MSSHYFVVPISTNRLSSFLALHYWQVYVLYTESHYPCLIMWSRTPDFSLVFHVFMGSVHSLFYQPQSLLSSMCLVMYIIHSHVRSWLRAIFGYLSSWNLSACSFPSLPVCGSVFNNDNSCFRIALNHLWVFLKGFFFSHPFFFSFITLMSMT